MIKRLFAVFLAATLCCVVCGCDNAEAKEKAGVAYAVSCGCPIKATVKVDGDGKIVEAKLNEYVSMYDIGKLEEGRSFGTEVVDAQNGYARFIGVGEKVFVLDNGVYENGTTSFDELISAYGGAEWYIGELTSGNFDILTAQGEPLNIPFDRYDGYKLSKNEWGDKLKNGYHDGKEYEYSYKDNVYKLITHVKNHDFYEYTGLERPSGKDGTYKIGKYDTLVNLPNFHDYVNALKKAYDKAVE